jgi:hypothetical protein
MKPLKSNLLLVSKICCLLIFLFVINSRSTAQVTEIYTDFGGYWKSTATTNNPIIPNLSNNVLAFTYNGVIYSTGVSDSTLNAHSVTITAGTYKALPISSIGGTIATGNSTFILLPSDDDGVLNGTANPLPSVRMNDVLTDGINGLDIASGVTNIPLNASMTFPVSTINTSAINDAQPDILYTEIAALGGNPDTLYFVDASGNRVGNVVAVTWSSVSVLGNYTCDLYTLTTGATCDNAVITGVNSTLQSKQIRLTAFKLSDFGITSGNASTVANLKIKPGGASDPAFVAYNAGAFYIPTPVVSTQPVTQVVCPGAGQNATFTVVASGTGLSYQWRKNGVNISGATSSSYTITNVAASDAAAYDVIVTNTGGSIQSTIAYLNTFITAQPSPASQTIATGNTVTLSVSATNATGFQWQRNGVNISGATSSSLALSPLTTTNGGTFTVSVINSASSGCANLLSTSAVVTPVTTLYSKNTVLNAAANWTVNSDGSSGSSPVDFTRAEHTFVVRTNASTTSNLSIAGTLDVKNAQVTITAGTTLTAGSIIRSGTTGTLLGSSTSSLTVGSSSVSGNSTLYFNSGSQLLQNLTIATGGNVTLGSALGITAGSTPGILTVNSGAVFNTSDSLTINSDANGTAMVGSSSGTITGKATVQRFIPAHRAWRFLTAPVTNSNTIYNAWQNKGVYTVGQGTMITMPAPVSNGLDAGVNSNYSMLAFNPATQGFVNVCNTQTNISPGTNGSADNAAYMIFVRGDRNPATVANPNFGSLPTHTTVLSCFGNLQTQAQVFAAQSVAGKYAVVGNPYASPVDFNNVTLNNVIRRFYTWDPTLNTVGGFVVLDDVDDDGIYDKSVSGSAQTQIIQSGQAIFIQTYSNGPASITFNESSKSTSNNNLVFRPAGVGNKLSATLYLLNADSSTILADGAYAQFDQSFSDSVTLMDAPKLSNVNENLSFVKRGVKLSIERRSILNASDTLFFNLSNVTQRKYRINLQGENIVQPGQAAFLEDNYSGIQTPVNLNGNSIVDFTVDTNVASTAPNRFQIVFRPSNVVPVTFVNIKALQQSNGNTMVSWTVFNETNIKSYQVEKSTDGISFSDVATVNARGVAQYNWLDANAIAGDNYYRICSIGIDGTLQYSAVVKVNITKVAPAFSVYPNPIKDGIINLELTNVPTGSYAIKLLGIEGQVFTTKIINHPGGNRNETISFNKAIAKGVYELKINGLDNTIATSIKLSND